MAATSTVSLYLAAPNGKNLCPLSIRYTFARKSTTFPTGFAVSEKMADLDRIRVKDKCPEAETINRKIDSIIARIKQVLANADEPPTHIYVKEKYKATETKEKDKKAHFRGLLLVNEMEQEDLEAKKAEVVAEKKSLEDHPFYKHIAPAMQATAQRNIKEMEVWFEKYLQFKQPPTKKRISKQTVKNYRTTFNWVVQFAQSDIFRKADLSLKFEYFGNDFYQAFYKWGLQTQKWSDGTFGAKIKDLSAFLTWCYKNQRQPVNTQYLAWSRPRESRTYPHYLSGADIDILWEWSKKEELPHYDKVRLHLTVFGLLTALRISDILKSEFVIDAKGFETTGRKYLKTVTQKTGGKTFLWMYDSRILEILEMYEYNLKRISGQKYNKGIKPLLEKIFKHHNLYQEKLKVFSYQNGEEVLLKEDYIWNLYSSHDNRRSCLSRFVNEYHWGIDEVLILIGSTDRRTLQGYIKNDPDQLKQRLSHVKLPNT